MADDQPQALPSLPEPGNATAAVAEEPMFTLAELFTKVAPGKVVQVSDILAEYTKPVSHGGIGVVHHKEIKLNRPEIVLHCGDEKCGGPRTFRWTNGYDEDQLPKAYTPIWYQYVCSNCQKTTKRFSSWMWVPPGKKFAGRCYKFGEYPPFGSPTPNRLLKLLGDNKAMYLQGRQCENQGLGIGAFAYYRRVVENQKDAIIDEIMRVSTKLKLSDDLVKALSDAKKETQFTKSVEAIKDGIPQALFIDGHNPLTLLHRALSAGLHAETDAACLEAAHVIRIVLIDLVERVGQALKSEAELTSALGRLMGNPSTKGP